MKNLAKILITIAIIFFATLLLWSVKSYKDSKVNGVLNSTINKWDFENYENK